VAVNLLGNGGYGREKFLEERYSLSRSEFWEVRQRILDVLEPLPWGRPRQPLAEHPTRECASCQEKDAQLRTLREEHARERERGRKNLILQAAVLPGAAAGIPLLEKAAFQTSTSRETVRTYIDKACDRAVVLMDSFPWAEKIQRLAADELFAGKTPILNCVEPRSMAIPRLQRGPDRTAETWEKVFRRFPLLQVVASDDGPGIVKAVRAVEAESQGDPFHSNGYLRVCLGSLERRAYKCIREQYKAEADLARRKKRELPWKRAAKRCRRACKRALAAMAQFDLAIQAEPLLKKAISPFDERGRWISYGDAQELIEQANTILQKAEAPYRAKVARTFDPNRILAFKAIIEAPSAFEPGLCEFEPEELIDLVVALTRPQPTEPKAEIDRCLAVLLDQKLAAAYPTWPDHRARIQDEVQHIFRSSSYSEAINSRLRVAQHVRKHLSGKFLALLALVHNATPFRGGKRRGRTPLSILEIATPPGSWMDWVRPK
jgi:hypothetical protein